MRTKFEGHSKYQLARKVTGLVLDHGWKVVTPIKNRDNDFFYGTRTYFCILEKGEAKRARKWNVL
jgi:hypothetical protein